MLDLLPYDWKIYDGHGYEIALGCVIKKTIITLYTEPCLGHISYVFHSAVMFLYCVYIPAIASFGILSTHFNTPRYGYWILMYLI